MHALGPLIVLCALFGLAMGSFLNVVIYSTKLEAGDELVLIGRSTDIDTIRPAASGVDDPRHDSGRPHTKKVVQKRTNNQSDEA